MEIKSLPTTSRQADELAKLETMCKSDLFILESRKNRVLRTGRISKNTPDSHLLTHEKIQIVNVGDRDIAKVMSESSEDTTSLLERYANCKSLGDLARFLSVNHDLRSLVDKKMAEVANATNAMCCVSTKRRATSMGSSRVVGYFLSVVDSCIEQHAMIDSVKKKLAEVIANAQEKKEITAEVLQEKDSIRKKLDETLDKLNTALDGNNELKVEIETLTKQIDPLKRAAREHTKIAAQCVELQKKSRMLRSDWNENAKTSRQMLERANLSLETLRAKIMRYEEEKKMCESTKEDATRSNAEIARLRKELDAAERDRDDALQTAFKANTDHATTIDTSKQIVETTRAEISALNGRVSALKRRNEELAMQRSRIDEQHRRHVDEKCERIKSLNKEIQDLKNTASHRERRLDMLLKKTSDGDRSFEEVFQEEFTAMREAYESQLSQIRAEREKDRVKSRVHARDLERAHEDTTRNLRREIEDLRFKGRLLRSKLGTYDTTYAASELAETAEAKDPSKAASFHVYNL